MTLKLVAGVGLKPLRFEMPDGGSIRFLFKPKRLGREERQTLLKRTGKGRSAVEILDLGRFVERTIEAIEGDIEIQDSAGATFGPGRIDSPSAIRLVLDNPDLPSEIFEGVVEHVMGENSLGEAEGNS